MDKRSDAIRKCGAEIVKLRKHIEDVDQERSRLRSQLKTLHRTTAEAEMVRVNRPLFMAFAKSLSSALSYDSVYS